MRRARSSRKLRCAALAACVVLGASAMAAAAPAHTRQRAHAAIVGGGPASPGLLPGVALVADNLGGGMAAYCTGTVVAANIVLTAAHCLEDDTGALEPASGFSVVTGTVNPSATPGQTSGVSRVLIFPQYNRMADNGDAGLLFLSTPTSAPAVTLADSSTYDQGGITVAVAGWGLTHATDMSLPTVLQWANFAIQDFEYCATADNHDGLQFEYGYEFCAGDPAGYTVAVCRGDSGGPAFAQTPAGLLEVGIVDRGDDACATTVPSIFTRVELIQPWVASQIAANPAPALPASAGSAGSAGSPGGAASSNPAPAAAPATKPMVPASGRYSGSSAQRRGSVVLTLGSSGIASARLTYNLRCARGWHGPITRKTSFAPRPAKLVSSAGAWTFNVRFSDGGGDRFLLSGRLPVLGRAVGTLSVTTPNHRCSSGVVAWSASLPTA
jgi:secreted trypsin-like serine protease